MGVKLLSDIIIKVLPAAVRRSNRKDLFSISSTQTTFCVIFSLVLPTRPTAKKM